MKGDQEAIIKKGDCQLLPALRYGMLRRVDSHLLLIRFHTWKEDDKVKFGSIKRDVMQTMVER